MRSQDQHRIAERVEAIALFDGLRIEVPDLVDAGERHDECEQRRAWQVEVRQERIGAAELEARRDEELGAALELRAARERLEHSHGCRSDSEHALRLFDPLPCGRFYGVALAMDDVLLEPCFGHGPERVEADVER